MRNFQLNFDHTRGRLAIGHFDQLTIQDMEFKCLSENEEGYVLERVDGKGVAQSFTHEHLLRLSADRAIRHDVDYFLPDTARRQLITTTDEISLLSAKARKRMSIHAAMVESAFDLKRSGVMTITDRSINKHMDAIRDGAVEYMVDELPRPEDPNKRHYGGGAGVRPDKVSARTLRKWMSAYRLDGLAGLVDGRSKSGRRKGYWTPEELALLEDGVRKFLDRKQPRQVEIIQQTRDMFHDANDAKREAGLIELKVPCAEAIRLRIKALDPFEVSLARYGETVTRKTFAPVGRGLELTRPLERVELDEWPIDLFTLLKHPRIETLFSEEELESLGLNNKKARWFVTVAICATTRCILGMTLSQNPKTSAAKRTLHMAMRNKGQWSDSVGALSHWDMRGTPELVVTDNGPAFKALEFREVANDLSFRLERTIAGFPELRARIERVFRTMATNLIDRFSGRAFSNVIERGEYKSEDRACLTIDDLSFVLVRWVVDVYHNTGHDGLGGETPLECWRRLSEVEGFRPEPGEREARLAFGVRIPKKTIAKDGITVLNVQYNSDRLVFHRQHDSMTANVRWLNEDIGAIEVEMDGKWHEVPATFDVYKGMSAQAWLAISRRISAGNPDEREVSENIVRKTWKQLDICGADAALSEGIIDPGWSTEVMEYQEKKNSIGFVVTSNAPITTTDNEELGRPIVDVPPKEIPKEIDGDEFDGSEDNWGFDE